MQWKLVLLRAKLSGRHSTYSAGQEEAGLKLHKGARGEAPANGAAAMQRAPHVVSDPRRSR
jgi:hypothetical protein